MKHSLFALVLFGTTLSAYAALDASRVHRAEPKKTQTYVREGLVLGGDRAVTDVMVKDIRRATNAGFERIVIDLDAARAPFYQVALEPEQKRIVFTVYGRSRLGLNAPKIHALFKKSPLISRVEIFPQIDDESWSFALHMKAAVPVEVFELSQPTRVIFDLKTQAPFVSQLNAKKPAPKALKKAASAYSAEESGASADEALSATTESDSAPE